MTTIPPHVSFLSKFQGSHILVTQPDKDKGTAWHHNASYNLRGLFKRNREDCGVFFTVNALSKRLDPKHRRTKKMLTHLRAIYADDDVPRPSPRTDFPLSPSLIVQSSKSANGYKYHYYWLLDEPLACSHGSPLEAEYVSMLKGLAVTYHTDPSSAQVNRILRIPGFYHHKHAPQMIVEHPSSTRIGYTWEVLKVAFPPKVEHSPIYNDKGQTPSGGDWKKHLAQIWAKKGSEAWPHYSAAAMSLANDKCDKDVALELIAGEVMQAFKDNGRPIEDWRMDNIKESVYTAYNKVSQERKLADPLSFHVEHKADPFPVSLLPDIVQSAVYEYARFIQVAPDSICASALSAMATVMGNKVAIIERPGLEHTPALGFIIAAGSGERKSPVFKHMFQPVKDVEKELVSIWRKDSAINSIKANVLVKKINKATKKLEEDESDEENDEEIAYIAGMQAKLAATLPKAIPQLYGMDITEETLGRVLSEQNGEFALLSAEARGIIDNITGKYSKGDKTGDSLILSAMTGDEIRNARGGNASSENRNSYVIDNPCLNLCLFIQPDKAIELISHPKLADSGLLARTFILSPESLIGTRMLMPGDAGIDTNKTVGYYQAVHKVGLACSASKRKIKMQLSPEAQEMHRQFNNSIESRFAGDLTDSIHLFNKIVSMSVKIGAVLSGLAFADELQTAITYGNKEAEGNKLLEGQPIIFEINAMAYGFALQITDYMIAMIRRSHSEMAMTARAKLTQDYLKMVYESKNRDRILGIPFKGKGSHLVNLTSTRFKEHLESIYYELVLRDWAQVSDSGIVIRDDFMSYSDKFINTQ